MSQRIKAARRTLTGAAATAALLLAFGAGAAEAQTRAFTVGVGGGAVFPVGDLSDDYGTGFDVSGLLEFASLGALPLGFRGEAGYQTFSEGNLSTRFLSGRANVVVPFLVAPDAAPYLIGGIGLYNRRAEDGNNASSDSDLGFNVGAGINYAIAGMNTFVELRLHSVSGDGGSSRFIPFTLGIRF